jgi:hypothetical protein
MPEPTENNNLKSPGDFERILRAIIERSVKHRAAAILISSCWMYMLIMSSASPPG